jgi:hypothetical protein
MQNSHANERQLWPGEHRLKSSKKKKNASTSELLYYYTLGVVDRVWTYIIIICQRDSADILYLVRYSYSWFSYNILLHVFEVTLL